MDKEYSIRHHEWEQTPLESNEEKVNRLTNDVKILKKKVIELNPQLQEWVKQNFE